TASRKHAGLLVPHEALLFVSAAPLLRRATSRSLFRWAILDLNSLCHSDCLRLSVRLRFRRSGIVTRRSAIDRMLPQARQRVTGCVVSSILQPPRLPSALQLTHTTGTVFIPHDPTPKIH